jgi:glycosyltransferase involved in cell wall biosynthesis
MEQSWGGALHYSAALLRILGEESDNQNGALQVFVYHNCADEEILSIIDEHRHLILLSDENMAKPLFRRIINRINRIFFNVLNNFGGKFRIQNYMESVCSIFKIDILHCPYQFIPGVKGVKLITTQHDVQELHFPEFFTAEQRASRAINTLDTLFRADKIIVSYKHVYDDVAKYYKFTANKIEIILLTMNKLWFDKFLSENSQKLIYDKFEFQKYLLYPAATWMHKNHENLLKTLVYLRDNKNFIVNLYCTGSINDHGEYLLNLVKEYKLENQVKFLGSVSNEELYFLYKNAYAAIIPSLYEAGSFPLIESIFLKIPVLCSNVTSLPETIGDERYVFDPKNILDIADKIEQLYKNAKFYNELKLYIGTRRDSLIDNNVKLKIASLYKSILN